MNLMVDRHGDRDRPGMFAVAGHRHPQRLAALDRRVVVDAGAMLQAIDPIPVRHRNRDDMRGDIVLGRWLLRGCGRCGKPAGQCEKSGF